VSLDTPDRVLSPIAPVTYCGLMGDAENGYVELWDLREDIPGHPRLSTVSRATLEKLGYLVPACPDTFGRTYNSDACIERQEAGIAKWESLREEHGAD
jgi:hypothetical protein